MTDRDTLRERLDAVEEDLGTGFTPEGTPTAGFDDTDREAIREAFAYRYRQGGELIGDPCGDGDARRQFLADAAEHVDDPYSTVLREYLAAGVGST